jgi:hypothetical protein
MAELPGRSTNGIGENQVLFEEKEERIEAAR